MHEDSQVFFLAEHCVYERQDSLEGTLGEWVGLEVYHLQIWKWTNVYMYSLALLRVCFLDLCKRLKCKGTLEELTSLT